MSHNPHAENTLVAVSAYSGDQHQVEQNMPCYAHHGSQIAIFSPEDGAITDVGHPGVVYYHAGLRGWIGKHTLERQRLFLEGLLRFKQEFFLLNDADSVCLSSRLPDYLYATPDVIWSNEVLDTNPAPSHLPKLALQPPYFFSRKVVLALLEAAKNLPVSYYAGAAGFGELPVPTECIDHWMLQVACGSGFNHHTFFTGASFETGTEHGAREMENLVRHHGRVLIHSVKTKTVLDRLIEAHRDFKKSHP